MTEWHLAFAGLLTNPALGMRLCSLAASDRWTVPQDLSSLCSLIGEPQSAQSVVVDYLRLPTLSALFLQQGRGWFPEAGVPFAKLADQLHGVLEADLIRKGSQDQVTLVLTKPPLPSQLAEALGHSRWGDWGIEDTALQLPWLVDQANDRVVVLTPFLDPLGAEYLVRLFSGVQGAEKTLIVRDQGSTGDCLSDVRPAMDAAGVKLRNYKIPRPNGTNETFHAKVILVDRQIALVGSFNFLTSSFEYSMEMGLQVSGPTAGRVADVIDAILKVADPI